MLTSVTRQGLPPRADQARLTHGPDPLHLAAGFGFDEETAIRYATEARELLETDEPLDELLVHRVGRHDAARHPAAHRFTIGTRRHKPQQEVAHQGPLVGLHLLVELLRRLCDRSADTADVPVASHCEGATLAALPGGAQGMRQQGQGSRVITSLALLAGGAALGAVGTFAFTDDPGALEAAGDPVFDEPVSDNTPLSCAIHSVPTLDTAAFPLSILTDGSPYVIVCEDSIARSPVVDATPPRHVRAEMTLPTMAQVHELLEAARAEASDFGTYLWVIAATGCRRGEACALRWSGIDLDRGELRIRRGIVHVGSDVVEKDTKTHQSRRLAIDETTVTRLREHLRRARQRALLLGTTVAPNAFLFADVEGRWRPDVCTNRFTRLRDSLGLHGVRLHDLRHFTATVLGDGGVPIATISARLDHRDVATTLNIYTHALPATDQLAATYLGHVLSAKPQCRDGTKMS